jgi:hypothetical protein
LDLETKQQSFARVMMATDVNRHENSGLKGWQREVASPIPGMMRAYAPIMRSAAVPRQSGVILAYRSETR